MTDQHPPSQHPYATLSTSSPCPSPSAAPSPALSRSPARSPAPAAAAAAADPPARIPSPYAAHTQTAPQPQPHGRPAQGHARTGATSSAGAYAPLAGGPSSALALSPQVDVDADAQADAEDLLSAYSHSHAHSHSHSYSFDALDGYSWTPPVLADPRVGAASPVHGPLNGGSANGNGVAARVPAWAGAGALSASPLPLPLPFPHGTGNGNGNGNGAVSPSSTATPRRGPLHPHVNANASAGSTAHTEHDYTYATATLAGTYGAVPIPAPPSELSLALYLPGDETLTLGASLCSGSGRTTPAWHAHAHAHAGASPSPSPTQTHAHGKSSSLSTMATTLAASASAAASAKGYTPFKRLSGKTSRTGSFSSEHVLMRDMYARSPGADTPGALGTSGAGLDKFAYERGKWARRLSGGGGGGRAVGPAEKRRRRWVWGGAGVAMLLLLVVIITAVKIAHNGKHAGQSATPPPPPKLVHVSGGNGSTVEMDDGTTFTYVNVHGGRWVADYLDDSAQAQAYTPPLSAEWDWEQNRIYGVNLGGWLVTEPFISPALYEEYENTSAPVVDEYGLAQRYLSEPGGAANLERRMRAHYDTFITEADFAQIAGAGLNWVRLPVGFWALETVEGEPFLRGVAWEYVLKAIRWAHKYGLRINLDLHAVPGSQNAYNHSGRQDYLAWLNGFMGLANAQRTLNYIRILAEFVSQPQVRKVVPMFSILNEPNTGEGIGFPNLKAFYAHAYSMLRNITGTGKDNGPVIALHDGFGNWVPWQGFMQGVDRVAYDRHPYVCFALPYFTNYDDAIAKVCNDYSVLSARFAQEGIFVAGEWSLALTDCGLFLNEVGGGTRYEGTFTANRSAYESPRGSCATWDDWSQFNATLKEDLRRFALAQMGALGNSFFWTWKIGKSLRTNATVSPLWNYKLGLEQGWMPTKIADAVPGACAAEGAGRLTGRIYGPDQAKALWDGTYKDWQKGEAASYEGVAVDPEVPPWPPKSYMTWGYEKPTPMDANAPAAMPVLVRNKDIFWAPAPTYPTLSESAAANVSSSSSSSSSSGDGGLAVMDQTITLASWFNTNDDSLMYGWPSNCAVVDPYWNSSDVPSGYPCTPQ